MIDALPAIEATIKSKADAYFSNRGPGLSVGLVLTDGLFYSQGFGFADAARTKVPDENTVFRAGSLSKVMTGTALLTLIDDPARHLSLEDAADRNNLLPELTFVCPDWGHSCTRGSQHTGIKLKHLVSHTAGLPDVMEQTNANVTPWRDDLKKSWLLFPPGTASAYSGVGVEGVGLIEQRVSGLSYPDFVKTNLFAPLGMTHSSMNPLLPEPLTAQKWLFSATKTGWSFAPFNSIIGGDDQALILPAGGLATNVLDLSRFIRMWLVGKAPQVNGRPLLRPETIASARNSIFSSTAPPPSRCSGKDGSSDANHFFYSQCGAAFGFGVSWFVGQAPYLQHNGDEPGLTGSNTIIDMTSKVGATGLISTEPFPLLKPQPAGLDGNFMGTVVSGLLTSGVGASQLGDWTGKRLATGVARVFWLSGKHVQTSDLDAFEPAFVAAHQLDATKLVALLNQWQAVHGKCSSFRVQSIDSHGDMALVFTCAAKDFDTTLSVESGPLRRIAWTTPLPTLPLPPPPSPQCLAACGSELNLCASRASSSSEHQQCATELRICRKACG